MMDENNNTILVAEDIGAITFANDVLAIIAGMAAADIEGVASMNGGIGGDIADLLGRKNLTKGIKITTSDKDVSIDVNMIAKYGFKLNEVAGKVQSSIVSSVETMTGLHVLKVNVNILGISFPKESPVQPTDSGSAE